MISGRRTPKYEKNIYLIGFMGAGKSTIGELLAKKLNRKFFDTDDLIIKELGISISQIFLERGELYFRDFESNMIKNVAKNIQAVIALGGGAILRQENWKVIKSSGVSIYLKWNIQTLLARILGDQERPLVKQKIGPSGKNEIERLLVEREPFYERADIILDCDKMEPAQIVNKIISALQEGK